MSEEIKKAIISKSMIDASNQIYDEISEMVDSGDLDRMVDAELKSEETIWDKIQGLF